MDTRYGKVQWGPNGTRVLTSPDNWKKPLKWDRWAAAGVCPACGGKGRVNKPPPHLTFSKFKPCERCKETGNIGPYRAKIFCASLADMFEEWGTNPILTHQGHVAVTDTGAQMCLDDVRDRLFALIDATPHCDWLMLTKRPENIPRMVRAVEVNSQEQADDRNERGELYRRNVWLGCSVAEQKDVDRNVPLLLKCRELSPVLWLSAEPMLGRLDFSRIQFNLKDCPGCGGDGIYLGPYGESEIQCEHRFNDAIRLLDWIICGCESNGRAVGRLGEFTTETEWITAAEELGRQCRAAGVPYFVKQICSNGKVIHDISQFPKQLQIQEFPDVSQRC